MKQLETKYQKKILSILNFYKEIGVDFSIDQNLNKQEEKFDKQNKNDTNIESNVLISNQIISEEKKAYEISITANNTEELQNMFQNFDGCSLKKQQQTLLNFREIKILIS